MTGSFCARDQVTVDDARQHSEIILYICGLLHHKNHPVAGRNYPNGVRIAALIHESLCENSL